MKRNFEKLKQGLSIEKVLKEYGMLNELKQNNLKLYGKCPIHRGDNKSAFHVNRDKNLWNCFTYCGGGTVIDLLMAIENTNTRGAFLIGSKMLGLNNKDDFLISKPKPLEFRLPLEENHPYLKKRNIEPNTARYFEIGYCTKGIMSNRIAIPIYDLKHNLVAYCGRAINDKKPKYSFPYGFEKNKIVYNLNRVKTKSEKEIVIVEGFFDVFRLHQAGIESVALMGSSLSYYQKQELENLDKRFILMLNGDRAGVKGMDKAINMLKEKKPLRAIYLPTNLQPGDLSLDYLRELVC